jgi:hypothetical protein
MALRGELFERDDEQETQRQVAPVGSGGGESPGLQYG